MVGPVIRHLPTRCLKLFRSLALTWGPRNQIPRQFLESRCVQIPKGSKVMEGCVSAMGPSAHHYSKLFSASLGVGPFEICAYETMDCSGHAG